MATSASPATGDLSATTVTITSATTTVTVNAGSPTTTITVSPTTDRRATRTARPASPTLVSGAGWFQRSHPLRRLFRRSRDRAEPQDNIVDERAGSLPTVPVHAKELPPAPQLTPAAPVPQPATELDSAPRQQPTMESSSVRERTPTLEAAPAPERPSSSNTTAGDPALTTPASALGDPLGPSAHSPSRAQVQRSTSSSPSQPDTRMAELWDEAIKQYEKESKRKLSALKADGHVLNSKEEIETYIRQNCGQSGAKNPVEYFLPVARSIEKLCGPLGNIVSAAFPPAGAIFSAIGILVGATISVKEDFQIACSAFETVDFHLRIIGSTTDVEMTDTLRTASVKVLAQVLAVFGVITKMRESTKIKTWLQRLCDPTSNVSVAMQNLGELIMQHHQSMSAATLSMTGKLMTALKQAATDNHSEHALTHAHLGRITSIAQETYGAVGANRGLLENIQNALLLHIAEVKETTNDVYIEKVTKWLCYPDCSSKLNSLMENRQHSTGSWFLDGPDFAAFKKATSKFLLVHGKAFCGKSTLMAAAAQELKASCASSGSDAIVLVHFFDVINAVQQERSLRPLLSSLLCQLAIKDDRALLTLRQSCSGDSKGYKSPDLDSMCSYLHTILRKNIPETQVHIIIDGLDETLLDQFKQQVISFILELCAHSNVSLLLSLRSPIMLLSTPSPTLVAMDNEQVGSDIEKLLEAKLAKGGPLGSARQEDAQRIRETVISKANGNFYWTALILQELAKVANIPSQISARLEAVPETVEKLYARQLEQVSLRDRDNVKRLLQWAVLSSSELSKEEFARLLAFDYSDTIPKYDPSLEPSPPEAAVTLVGSTFVSIDGAIVRLTHTSVKDYLLGLSRDDFFHINPVEDYNMMARIALAHIKDPALALKSSGQFTWSWVTYVNKAGANQLDSLAQEAITGLENSEDGRKVLNTALLTSVQSGNAGLVKVLTEERRADIRATSKRMHDFTPLHSAAYYGHSAVVKQLLDRKADVDSRDQNGLTPLLCAASHGHTEIVKELIAFRANIHAADNDGWTALHHAANAGHLEVIQALASARAGVNNRAADWQTPLHCAAKMVHPKAIRLLCKLRANQDALEKFGRSPLRLAIYWREEHSVEALMKARPCSFSAHDAVVELEGSGRWKGVPDDLARDTRIRQMLQRQWPKEEEGPEEEEPEKEAVPEEEAAPENGGPEERGGPEEEGGPEERAGPEEHDTPKISVPASYAHDFGSSPLIPFMLFLLIILLLLNLIHGLH